MASTSPPNDPSRTTTSSASRRALLRTAAWGVPTATIAIAAPAVAASPPDVSSVRIWTGGSITMDRQSNDDLFWFLNYNVSYDGGGTSGPDFPVGSVVFTVQAAEGTTIQNPRTIESTAYPWTISVSGRTATIANAVPFPWDGWNHHQTDRFQLGVHSETPGAEPATPTVSLSPALSKQGGGWQATSGR